MKVILNRPSQSTDNGIVERDHGVVPHAGRVAHALRPGGHERPQRAEIGAVAPEGETHRVQFILPSHLVVDRAGRVAYRGFGPYMDELMRALDAQVAAR